MMDTLELTDDTGRVLARYDGVADDVTFDWPTIQTEAQTGALARILLAALYGVGYVPPGP